MLKKGQLYFRNGIVYQVESFEWISSSILKVVLINTANDQELLLTTSAASFMSSYSLLPPNLQLIRG